MSELKSEIKISAKILFEMFQYAFYAKKNYNSEIAGWGHWQKNKGIYKLAPLTYQEVPQNGLEVEMSPDDLLKTDYDMSDMLVRWHSHVNCSTSLSKTDNDTIKELLRVMPFVISVVVNVKLETTCQVDINLDKILKGRNAGLFHSDTATMTAKLIPYFSDNECEKIVQEKVKVIVPQEKDYPAIGVRPAIDVSEEYYTGAELSLSYYVSRALEEFRKYKLKYKIIYNLYVCVICRVNNKIIKFHKRNPGVWFALYLDNQYNIENINEVIQLISDIQTARP
jgi:proteasome lid subunit RPN8/RPN11